MSEATQQASARLRQLAVSYAAGELHASAYRARRARLLDALVGLAPRSEDLDITRPRAPAVTPAAAPVPAPRAAPIAAPPVRARSGRSRWLAPGLALLLLLALAAAWWALRVRAPAAAPPPAVADAAGDAFIEDFLSADDWSDAALSRFNTAWWGLSDAQLAPLLSASSTMQLRAAVATQLRARADAVAGGGTRLDPSAPLILLARNLNVAVPAGATVAFNSSPAVNSAGTEHKPAAVAVASKAAAPTTAAAASDGRSSAAVSAAAREPTAANAAANANVASSAAAAAGAAAQSSLPDACHAFFSNPRYRFCHDALPGGAAAPALVIISAGSYSMGSEQHPEESPVHEVRIARPFAVSVSEITLGEYRLFCAQSGRRCPPQPWPGDTKPVVNVSWNDALEYAQWLSAQTGQHYRLPSESEWEYLARADSKGDYWSGAPLNASQARFAIDKASAPDTPADQGEAFQANAWSVKHVAGNVREWTADVWAADYHGAPADASARSGAGDLRVVRGGSYRDTLPNLRSAARQSLGASSRDAVTGIRLVRELSP